MKSHSAVGRVIFCWDYQKFGYKESLEYLDKNDLLIFGVLKSLKIFGERESEYGFEGLNP